MRRAAVQVAIAAIDSSGRLHLSAAKSCWRYPCGGWSYGTRVGTPALAEDEGAPAWSPVRPEPRATSGNIEASCPVGDCNDSKGCSQSLVRRSGLTKCASTSNIVFDLQCLPCYGLTRCASTRKHCFRSAVIIRLVFGSTYAMAQVLLELVVYMQMHVELS